MPGYRIEPLAGYTPAIGRLVDMMTYARSVLLRDIAGLSQSDLDHLHDPGSNTIGALLMHVAAVECDYQVLTFEEREWPDEVAAPWRSALELGDAGRRDIRGRPLETYLSTLAETRAATLEALAQRDDDWLARPLVTIPEMNAHWAWFHTMEDEINHRGQIRWLRARLPS